MQKMVKPIRLVVLAVVFVLLLGVYFVALYKLQIIGGREYYAVGETETKEDITIAAARGNILDRYGRLLVSNSLCNNLSINVTELFSQDDPNAVILELCSAVERFGDTYTDTLPITKAPPFEFTEMDTLQKSMLDAWLKANDMPLDSSAVEILAAMRTRYSVGSEYNAEDARRIVGVRYEINDRFNINTTPYVFAEDVSMPLLTYLMEQDIPGFELSSSYVREYKTQYAAHLLGYTGKLTAEEWATYAGKDYSLDAYVGKDGVEYAFEEYLHGVDGEAEVYSNLDGVTLRTKYTKEPQPGGHVYLTLDIGLQEVCEEALAAHIESINEDRARIIAEAEMYGTESTEMISGGALCVVKVDTGEPLALVSYPTYDAATMLDNYETLVADENAPLYNRALMGVYAPGSTFKPCTATALLAEGIISPTRTLKTEGQFTKYIDDGYAPECWIYSTYKYTHGEINVVQAITYSCNYFFYYFGDELGIDKMAYYAKLYGLGEHTGIELPEVTGQMSTQSFKEQYTGISWFQGDTLQSAIGQSFTEFTPLQMAEYCAAIANGGTVLEAQIVDKILSSDGAVVTEKEPVVVNQIEGAEEHLSIIREGMHGVISAEDGGTAAKYWSDFPNTDQIGAKTGTAQVSRNSEAHAIFVAFAPYENPEIAISIVVEHGGSGTSVAEIAAEIFSYYFSARDAMDTPAVENTLIR